MSAWHPELDLLTEELDAAADTVRRRARDLDTHHMPDDWVARIDGEWHTCRPGRGRGGVAISADTYATKREALDEVLAETQAQRRRVAALAARGGGRG